MFDTCSIPDNVAAQFDLDRLAQIREVMGVRLGELVGGMLETMGEAIEQAEQAMRAGDLEQAAKAAHSCRNDALMLGAQQLLAQLGTLEQTARAGDGAEAAAALARVHAVWPPTRAELVRIVSAQ